MAVSAAAAFIVVMLMSATVTAAFAAFIVVMLMSATVTAAFAAVTVMMSATAAAACQVLDEMLYFLLGGLTVLNDCTREVQRLACQGMVGIDGHAVFLNLHHLSHKLVVLVVHQGDNGTLKNILVVEMSVYGKYLAVHLVHTLGYILAESLCWSQLEIKVAALLKALYLLLEGIECYAEAGDKLKWTVIASLLFELTLAILQAVQLVYNRHESVFCFFHYTYYIYTI